MKFKKLIRKTWLFLRIQTLFSNSYLFALDYIGLLQGNYVLRFWDGYKIKLRPHTVDVSDIDILKELVIEDVYKLKSMSKNPRNIVDLGAQIGIFTLLVAKRYPNAKIITYEPEKENFRLLVNNIRINNLKNVKSLNLGVSGKRGKRKLYLSNSNSGAHSIYGKKGISYETFRSIKFDDIIKNNGLEYIDILKMDCEGAEYEILLNANKYYLKKVDIILMELHETDLTRKKYKPTHLLSMLKASGFKISVLKKIYYPDEGKFWIIIAKSQNAPNQ